MSKRELSGQACECSECGEQFRSLGGFNAHRVGTYRPTNTRRCLSTDEIAGLGMVLVRGRWQRMRKAPPTPSVDGRDVR